jgi:hypothetical protein
MRCPFARSSRGTLVTDMDASAHPGTENAAEFARQRDDVFGRIASRYDRLCDLLSLER